MGEGGCCPISVSHGQPQRTRSLTSGPGILLAQLGEVVKKMSLFEAMQVQQVETSHLYVLRLQMLSELPQEQSLSDMTLSGTFLHIPFEHHEKVVLAT